MRKICSIAKFEDKVCNRAYICYMRSDYIPVTYGRLSSNNDWFLRKLLFFFISNKKVFFFFFLVSSSSFWQKSSSASSLLLCEVSSVSVKYLFSFKLVYICVCVCIYCITIFTCSYLLPKTGFNSVSQYSFMCYFDYSRGLFSNKYYHDLHQFFQIAFF